MIDAVAATAQQNPLVNQVDNSSASSGVMQAIKLASAKSGVDFSYLLKKASQESSFNPNAKASTSSATGLYQFTKQTWLQMIKAHGAEYGLDNYANMISVDANGVAHVDDPAARKQILDLRKDPTVASEMSAELDKENLESLKGSVGGKIGPTELYLAHFLGAGGAAQFIREMRADPSASAAASLPDAAAANTSVFYDKGGNERTLGQIYKHFAQKFDAGTPSNLMVASVQPVVAPAAAAPTMQIASLQTAVVSSPISSSAPTYLPAPTAGVRVPVTGGSSGNLSSAAAATSSSLFATMVLAQMQANASSSNDLTHLFGVSHAQDVAKKNVADTLLPVA